MITYKESHKVYLDKKHIGDIKAVEGGFAYFPKGSKTSGDVKSSVAAVKRDIEGR